MRSRGHTLIEALVAGALLVVLLGLVLSTYAGGSGALRKIEAQSDLQSQAQVLTMRLSQDLLRANSRSLSLEPQAVAMLLPAAGMLLDDESHELLYDRYVVYYRQGQEVRRREVALAPDAPERSLPGPIESYGARRDLAFYCTEGQLLASGVTLLNLEQIDDRLLLLEVEMERKRYGKDSPDRFKLTSGFRLHN